MSGRLDGRVAVVTGAGRGIGRAIACALAADGAAVAAAARTEREVRAVADEIARRGGRAEPLVVDVTDSQSVDAMVSAARAALGPIGILVNNAGAAGSHKFVGHPDALWHRMIEVNLTGTYQVTRAVALDMHAAGWGRVVNIGSVASLTGARYIAAYTAAKHGVLGLTRALAAEWVRAGITVNMIAPGYVDTPMTDSSVANITRRTALDEEAARSAIEGLSPQRRLIAPEEIVPLVRLLVDDDAASITGAVLPIDAGISAIAASG